MRNSPTPAAPAVARMPRAAQSYHHGSLAPALQRAVVDVVGEHGLGAVTMAECARRAGVSAAAPYRHYASLDDLLLATAQSCYEKWNARRERHAVDLARPERALRELLDDFFAFARDEPGAFILIFDSGLQRHSELLTRWTRDGYDQFLHIVSAVSGFPVPECRVPALGIIAVVFGHAKMSLAGFSGVPLDRAAELSMEAITMLLDGFMTGGRIRPDRAAAAPDVRSR